MEQDTALIFAYDISAAQVQELSWDDLKTPPDIIGSARYWLHFDRQSERAEAWLKGSGLVPDIVMGVLFQEESRPRAFRFENGVVVNLRGVNKNEGAEPEDLISLRIYATQNLLVTTRASKVSAVDYLHKTLCAGAAPTTNAAMVAFLANKMTENLEPVTQGLEEEVDAIEEDMLDEMTPPPKLAVANFRRSALFMRRYIYPQREAISSLMHEADDFLSKADQLVLRETQDTILRLSEQLDMVRERAVVLQEQIVEVRAEDMNQRLFVLAIISAIFLPLGFVTGLFGINVGGMPGTDDPGAFWILSAAMLAMVGGLLLFFKKMKWF